MVFSWDSLIDERLRQDLLNARSARYRASDGCSCERYYRCSSCRAQDSREHPLQPPAALVMELRAYKGDPVMDCREALQRNDCDLQRAKDWLDYKGRSKG